MNQLEILISSQEEQEKRGNLTEIGISYLNGLRTAVKIQKEVNSNSNDEKILYWAKQLEGKKLSLHELVENATWLVNHIK